MPPPLPHPERPQFLAASRGIHLEPAVLAELAAWLDLTPWPDRPCLPTNPASFSLRWGLAC